MPDWGVMGSRAVAALGLVVMALVALGVAAAVDRGTTPVAAPGSTSTHGGLVSPPSGSPPVGPSPLARRVPGDAAGLAAQLAATEDAIRDPATPPGALPALGQLEQLDYGTLTAHPGWYPTVLAKLPGDLRLPAGLIVDAGRQLDALDAGSVASDLLPAWRVIAPLPTATLLGDYKAAAATSGVPWSFLAAINLVETRMGRIRGDSSAGAQGPMQFLPTTWSIYGAGGDIDSPRDAVAAAARLLVANGAPGDMARALYHYNASAHYVRAVTDYAMVMAADPRAYLGFYQWQVFVTTLGGEVLLPVGYGQR